MSNEHKLSSEQIEKLLSILEKRFVENIKRHPHLKWSEIKNKISSNPNKLWCLNAMEESGGEPDVVGFDSETGEYLFCDCSQESPKNRRSLCYDRQALEERQKYPPEDSAMNVAEKMGISLLTEQEYFELQKLVKCDTKTSSWLKTPDNVRRLGGAIFGDFRYGRVFIYHNGADSYYAARGFRGKIRV